MPKLASPIDPDCPETLRTIAHRLGGDVPELLAQRGAKVIVSLKALVAREYELAQAAIAADPGKEGVRVLEREQHVVYNAHPQTLPQAKEIAKRMGELETAVPQARAANSTAESARDALTWLEFFFAEWLGAEPQERCPGNANAPAALAKAIHRLANPPAAEPKVTWQVSKKQPA
ncbi:MAG: hypothetical protein L0Y71_20370 [Gemmataceae bacterium]|nr:hypothetical protein [Gemmataceae bacterium]